MKFNKKDIIIGICIGIVTIGIGFELLYRVCDSVTTPTTQIEIFNKTNFNDYSAEEIRSQFSKSMAHMISEDYETNVTAVKIDNEYWIDFDIHTSAPTINYSKGFIVLEGCAIYNKTDGFKIRQFTDNRTGEHYISDFLYSDMGYFTQEEIINALESILSDLN